MRLELVDDELATCVSCGLCLPHCPTYRVTGDEALSPRGRIAAMREVQWNDLAVDESFVHSMDTCVVCRGCETACPSGVPFGHLMEATRATLARERPTFVPRWQRLALRSLEHHRLLLAGSKALGLAQRARLVPAQAARRLGLPTRVPVRQPQLRGSGADVWLFTGCVMDAWLRPVHHAVQRVIEAAGAGVRLPGPRGSCCGALHGHAGLGADARRLAERTMSGFPGPAPIMVDSAGCGAQMKDYGRLLGTLEAEAFAARVYDIHEWLGQRLDRLPPPRRRLDTRVTIQDPCHLRHVQRAHEPVRTVLAPYVEIVELDDEGLCCGAGGAYATVQPELAGAIRERKRAAIERSGARVVASANPGCAMHLASVLGPMGVEVVHPIELVDRAIT
ncbi:MAG: (Fe-S)-binding protein [Acidimicrobiales bacterium]